jgi:ComF family protein
MTALAHPMGSLLANAWRDYALAADLVVAVPLSGLRRRTRGYNQAETLARELAGELRLPWERHALRRTRHTGRQARTLDAEARRRNVARAFVAGRPIVAGKAIVLVDDVTTTGATLASCSAALKEAGAHTVHALAFARED